MFVVKTHTSEPIYKTFGTSRAAQRWAENGAYLEHEAHQCQIYRTISGMKRTTMTTFVLVHGAWHGGWSQAGSAAVAPGGHQV